MKISIVVPVLNEEGTIRSTLAMLEGLAGDKEIIFADGGSSDRTIELISGRAKIVTSKKGRATQMNAGAAVCTGDVIFFLHCDSKVSEDIISKISQCCTQPQIVGGGLTLEIDDPGLIFKIIAFGSNLRPKLSKIFFGDQGIFVKREVFEKIGGFPEIDLMEDWEFCRSLRKTGKIVQLPDKIITSSRRWHKFGIWKTIRVMHKLKVLYLLGESPQELNRIYRDAR